MLALACATAVTSAFAQHRKAHKLRATAVVEVTTDSAGIVGTHIFPVTILDEGSFHDASIYKATPEPMALDKGIVYEAQSDGIPVGYATVLSSTNNKGWTALGKWQLAEEPKKAQAPPLLLQATTGRSFIVAMPHLQLRLPALPRRALLIRQAAPLQVCPLPPAILPPERRTMLIDPFYGAAFRSRNQLPRRNLRRLRQINPQRDRLLLALSCL